jgi:hypothetical protein
MQTRFLLIPVAGLLLSASTALGGNIYRVTSHDGDREVTYEVQFGGGRLIDRFTAFDPEEKKFVYLTWKRQEQPPKPAMKIWDHQSRETISLYAFPNAKHPLPVIPSIEAMKVCPITGDKNFKAKLHVIVD